MTVQTLRRGITGVLRPNMSMEAQLAPREKKYVFLRRNAGDAQNAPSTKLTEQEALLLLAVCFRRPDRAVERLKKGERLETRFATYVAIPA